MSEQGIWEHEDALTQLYASLRKPRSVATEEVNWLLVVEARSMRNDHDSGQVEADSWVASVDRQLDELFDEPSTGYELESRRIALEASRSAAEKHRTAVEATFDERRETFAKMLVAIRENPRAMLLPDSLEEIRLLNSNDYLANALGMEPKRFTDYYAYHPDAEAARRAIPVPQAPAVDSEFDLARKHGIDYSRVERVEQAAPAAPAAPTLPAVAPSRIEQVIGAETSRLAQATGTVPPEPARDDEPGFDY
ncbi:MAG TPA: hypothetical protein VFU07_05290 [Candidatus Lumbricidophila sp.]|nr:hypothetical protein [Candidatus Lumbricidophila sp.]